MKWNFTNSYDCNRELLLHPGFDQISTKINEVAANRGEKNFRQRKSHLFLFPLCEIWTVFNLFRAFSPKLGSIGSMKWASWRAPGETPECKSGIKFSNTSVTFPIYPKVLRYFLPDYAFVRARWTADEFANPPIPSETANFAIFIPGISRRYFRRSVEKYTYTYSGSIYWPRAETWKGKTWNTLNKPVQFGNSASIFPLLFDPRGSFTCPEIGRRLFCKFNVTLFQRELTRNNPFHSSFHVSKRSDASLTGTRRFV